MKIDILKNITFTKRQKLLLILLLIAVLSIVASFIVGLVIKYKHNADAVEIALVAPLSGSHEEVGKALKQSAQLFVEQLNDEARLGDRTVVIKYWDDENDPRKAVQIARDIVASNVIAVVGHWSEEVNQATLPIYAKAKLPVLLPNSTPAKLFEDSANTYATVSSVETETRFLANYVRNVLGNKGASIIHANTTYYDGIAESFKTTFEQFGTQIRNIWKFDSVGEIESIIEQAKEAYPGTIFLAMPEVEAVEFLKALRANNMKNQVVGLSSCGSNYFYSLVEQQSSSEYASAFLTDQMLVTTPRLFDTSGTEIRNFASSYQERYQEQPDWIVANIYTILKETVQLLNKGDISRKQEDKRKRLSKLLEEKPIEWGAIRVGLYNGKDIVSALTQLEPIQKGEVENYIDAVIKKRALLVNGKFMYKTNVVYTGTHVNSIKELDIENSSADIDFYLWFRYRGDFEPQDILFNNALDTIVLNVPLETKTHEGLSYKSYHVKGKFKINAIEGVRSYGTHIIGLSFDHKELSTNNLTYVVDTVGMGLQGGSTFLGQLKEVNVFSTPGWRMDNAWIGQRSISKLNLGAPEYVRYNSANAAFSQIDFGILAVNDKASIKDFISDNQLIYLFFLGFFGSIISMIMDYKDRGRFWRLQSWAMRSFFMPITILTSSSLLLDYMAASMPYAYIDIVVKIFSIIWWILGAYLFVMLVERGLWMTLEETVNRPVPNVIRGATSFVIYTLSILGLLAFDFGYTITSLLATSGLGMMVIGLAIQGNIANVFSGIAINLERPFNIGDWVKIGGREIAEVMDMTWRTVRLKTEYNNTVCIPNTEVGSSEIVNFSVSEIGIWSDVYIEIPESREPEHICEYLVNALSEANVEGVSKDEDSIFVSYCGTANNNFHWVEKYCVMFLVSASYNEEFFVKAEVLKVVREALNKEGVFLGVPEKFSPQSLPPSSLPGSKIDS